MAATQSNTVVIKGRFIEYREADAAAAISPGDLVELTTALKVQRKAGAADATNYPVMVARENEIFGLGLESNYAVDDRCLYVMPNSGAEVLLTVAAGEAAIAVGDKLESVAAGTVQTVSTGRAIAIALEAVDNSGGGAKVRIKALII